MEKLLYRIGGFGKYQKLILLLIGLIASLTAFTVYSSIFTSGNHRLTCVSNLNNVSKSEYESCQIWTEMQEANTTLDQTYNCEFSHEYYGNTIINEWGLQCNKIYLASLLQSIFMVGCMFTFVGGWISDRYGRRKALIGSAILLNITIVVCEILVQKFNFLTMTQYNIYIVSQFLIGLLGNNMYITAYILIVELTSAEYSTIISTINLYMYIVGELMLLFFAYISRDWHMINMFVAIFTCIMMVLIIFLVPESPRFLISNKHYEQAYSVLQKIARVNGRSSKMFSREKFFGQIDSNKNGTIENHLNKLNDATNFHEIQSLLNIELKTSTGDCDKDADILDKKSGSVWFFLLNPITNLLKTLCMCYVWVALTMIYYGVSLGITSLGSNLNPYFMYTLSCIAEFIGYSLCFINDRYSMKKTLVVYILAASLFCLTVSAIPKDELGVTTWRTWMTVIFATMGKSAASASFNSIFVYTNKMYPTNVRNTFFALCFSFGRIGALVSPPINLLRFLVWGPLPYLIFSLCAFVAVAMLLFLPDPSKYTL